MAKPNSESFEINFDGLVGPTHSYAGLSYGNIASVSNKAAVSSPREAALQGLGKMRELAKLGFRQALLPPQERPDLAALRRIGFTGSDAKILEDAGKSSPELLAAVSSASSMWTANAATVAPSADTADGKVHFTPANLVSKFHRSIEHETTGRVLKAIFRGDRFVHHPALPSTPPFGDEGAANHTRFCANYGGPGVQFFVYGRNAFRAGEEPKIFPARQTREASEAIARLHRLESAVFAQQNPIAIDAGAFHNDVVSVGNQNALFYHEQAFLKTDQVLAELEAALRKRCGVELVKIRVEAKRVSLEDAVKSYLFNSQLLDRGEGMLLVAPTECRENPRVSSYLEELLQTQQTPIREVKYFDLRQSMRNGGGPACLRLRVVLTKDELAACAPGVLIDEAKIESLSAWVKKHYRDRLSADDLRDPKLLDESRAALDELTRLLGIGSVYPFQLGTS